MELTDQSASALAALIRSRNVSSREVVDAHIARIEQVNPELNAVVEQRYEAARAEADTVDRDLSKGDEARPFAGVPCTIKESFALTGMKLTAGLLRRRGVESTDDATAVSRMRSAGLIPLGTTNVSELLMWMESNNRVYGRCNNAYDRSRTAGGSSGGEGAIVGAGASPVGLGADIGGSIRMPAFFNGVFGHKPTGGLVPNTGQWPLAENEALRYLTTGPLCRRAEDLYPMVRLMAGPDGEDHGCIDWELKDPALVSVPKLRVLLIRDDGRTPVTPELREAQERVVDHLEALGCVVREQRIPELRYAFEIWSAMMEAAAETPFSEHMVGEGRLEARREFVRWALRRSKHTLPALALSALESLPGLMEKRALHMREVGQQLRQKLSRAIGDGVLIYPSYSRVAPRHYTPMLTPLHWVYTGILNVMELPSTQVPLGLSRGLPLGVQIVSNHGEDHRSIAVAVELERAFGGWVPPAATSAVLS
ncbi:MAG: amidase [Myxococcota bacterium]